MKTIMTKLRGLIVTSLVMGSLLMSSLAMAAAIPEAKTMDNTPKRFGDYEVHFSAFPSTFITPEIAKAYKLERGPRNGIVNISVRNVKSSEVGKAVTASLKGSQTMNLLSQSSNLTFNEVKEGDAIYYLADFRFTHQEMLKFSIKVQPEGSGRSETFEFRQQFYEEGK